MKYTAQDERQVTNIAQGKAYSATFVMRPSSRVVYFHTNEGAVF